MPLVLLVATLLIAFVNGANDNMKGVATLYGSGVLGYRQALGLATVSTVLGSLVAMSLSTGLAQAFSAKGLLPSSLLTPSFLTAVAISAAGAVLLATRFGMPVSTTHALVGGIVGAGLVQGGAALNLAALGSAFVRPLVAGPVLGAAVAAAVYGTGRALRHALRVEPELCVCVDRTWVPVVGPGTSGIALARSAAPLQLTVDTTSACQVRYRGQIAGVSAQQVVDGVHVLSGGLVGFARGLNDTPKLMGLLVGVHILAPSGALVAITAVMALGGLASRRVAETMAKKVTEIHGGQGLAANLATSALVTLAARLGLPVSTTHVAVGSIFGTGATRGRLRWRTVGTILLAWFTTLPLAAALGAASMLVLR